MYCDWLRIKVQGLRMERLDLTHTYSTRTRDRQLMSPSRTGHGDEHEDEEAVGAVGGSSAVSIKKAWRKRSKAVCLSLDLLPIWGKSVAFLLSPIIAIILFKSFAVTLWIPFIAPLHWILPRLQHHISLFLWEGGRRRREWVHS